MLDVPLASRENELFYIIADMRMCLVDAHLGSQRQVLSIVIAIVLNL